MAVPATLPGGAPPDGGAGGLPQFDVAMWPGQMLWVLAIFAVLYFLFSRVFVPRVGGAIDAREDRISGAIGEARRLRDKAQADMDAAAAELGVARGRAQKVAAEAQNEAKAAAAQRQAEEETKLADVLGRAEARIAEARAEAMGHVRAIAMDTAQAMVARLTGTEASREEVSRALDALPAEA